MKTEAKYRQVIFIFMLGFILGILYTNIIATRYVTITNIFQENILKKYLQIESFSSEYTKYILSCRMVPFLFMFLISKTKYRKLVAVGSLMWTGFSAGVLLVTSVLCKGVRGIVICIIAMCPHIFIYGLSYSILIIYCLNYHETRWNKEKTISVFLLQIAGILVEGHLNPWLMKWLLNIGI